MLNRVIVALVALVALSSALDSQYQPSAGVSDLACYNSVHTHAVWLPGVATDLVFLSEPEEPNFVFDAETGTARMTGRVQDGNVMFDVDVTFSGFVGPEETAPSGSPKRELKNECYVGAVDPATWSYFTGLSGFLTAVPGSFYEGGVITIGRDGPAMQVGIGANGKNTEFGFSAWLTRSVQQQPTNGNTISFSGSHGDFNMNLAVVAVPECGCGSVTETLFSGQTIDTGTVTWNYDGEFLFTAESTDGWVMHTVHIHVSNDEPPTTGSGNPQIGHFNYPFVSIDTDYFTASIDAPEVVCGSTVYIAFHAEMELIDEDGSVIQTETGFAEGPNEFDGNRWGWYSTYETCCDSEDCNFEGCRTDSECDNGGNVCANAVCFSGNCVLENNDAYQVGTTCGVDACASSGVQVCVDQQLVDSCDITATDGLVLASTSCGMGVCASTGQIVCANGAPLPDSCSAGLPESENDVCDGRDENCNGQVDEDFVIEPTTCGADGCESSGVTRCAGFDGILDNCDITATDGLVLANTNCGLGICAASGQIVCANGAPLPDSCSAGLPESDKDVCDGRDENCDGQVDEDFVIEPTTCGADGCESSGVTRCAGFDGILDNCDITATDGLVLANTNCGLGICAASGQIVCANGAPLPDSCSAGLPESDKDVCDGRDENCDGQVDEDFVAQATTCGFAECASAGVTSCNGFEGVVDSCDVSATDNDQCNTDLCILGEFCSAGNCGGGAAKSCDDLNDCTVDTCDSSHGYCEHESLDSAECSGTIPVDVEVNCASNTTTICYEVFTNNSPALSHWALCIPENVEVTGTGPAECPDITAVGVDGSIDFDGNMVKFDCNGEPDSQPWSGIFCLTFEGVYDVSEDGLAVVKRARLQEYTTTIGIADCGTDAQQSDICDTSVTVEIDFSTANKVVRAATCTDEELRQQLAQLAGVSALAVAVYENDDDHVTVSFMDSASASGAEAAATLMEAIANGARPSCLREVETVALVDIPQFSSYEFDGFSASSNSGASNSGASNSNSNSPVSAGEGRSRSGSSDAASLASSLALLFVALAIILC